MSDAKRLAQACNNYGVTGGMFYAACILLAEHGIENALDFVREIAHTPTMPEWKEAGDLEQAAMMT